MHRFEVEYVDGTHTIVEASGVRGLEKQTTIFYVVPDWDDRTKDQRVAFFNRDQWRAIRKQDRVEEGRTQYRGAVDGRSASASIGR